MQILVHATILPHGQKAWKPVTWKIGRIKNIELVSMEKQIFGSHNLPLSRWLPALYEILSLFHSCATKKPKEGLTFIKMVSWCPTAHSLKHCFHWP